MDKYCEKCGKELVNGECSKCKEIELRKKLIQNNQVYHIEPEEDNYEKVAIKEALGTVMIIIQFIIGIIIPIAIILKYLSIDATNIYGKFYEYPLSDELNLLINISFIMPIINIVTAIITILINKKSSTKKFIIILIISLLLYAVVMCFGASGIMSSFLKGCE